MPDHTPFVRVYFNDGTAESQGYHPDPLTRDEANALYDSYDGLEGKHVITVERVNCIDEDFEIYAYNLVGSLIYEWRKGDRP